MQSIKRENWDPHLNFLTIQVPPHKMTCQKTSKDHTDPPPPPQLNFQLLCIYCLDPWLVIVNQLIKMQQLSFPTRSTPHKRICQKLEHPPPPSPPGVATISIQDRYRNKTETLSKFWHSLSVLSSPNTLEHPPTGLRVSKANPKDMPPKPLR